MTANRITFMPRDQFAGLSLQQKNEYLCDLAARFCTATNRPAVELDKEALSRLRRFYSRRSFADLGVKNLPDDDLGRALRGLSHLSGARLSPCATLHRPGVFLSRYGPSSAPARISGAGPRDRFRL